MVPFPFGVSMLRGLKKPVNFLDEGEEVFGEMIALFFDLDLGDFSLGELSAAKSVWSSATRDSFDGVGVILPGGSF
jgi:hypothetical protein